LVTSSCHKVCFVDIVLASVDFRQESRQTLSQESLSRLRKNGLRDLDSLQSQ
jgi:hypothetical protein